MPRLSFTESVVEEAALGWFEGLGYTVVSGPDIAPEEPGAERDSYDQVILHQRLKDALARLNPALRRASYKPSGTGKAWLMSRVAALNELAI